MFEINERRKRVLINWIGEQIQEIEFSHIYDPFSGTGGVGNFFKRKGCQIFSSDILYCNYYWNYGLNQNNTNILTPVIQKFINQEYESEEIVKKFDKWIDQYFTEDEVKWLGIWFYNIFSSNELNDEHRALACIAVYLVMNYWITYNCNYLQQKSISPPDLINLYFQRVNSLVYDNYKENVSYLYDSYDIADKIETHVCYIYPPSPEGFRNYDLRFYLWECWTRGVTQLNLEGVISKSDKPKLGEYFDNIDTYLQALNNFLSLIRADVWILSYNDQIPALKKDNLVTIIKKYRKIWKETEKQISYPSAAGVSTICEGLIIAVNE